MLSLRYYSWFCPLMAGVSFAQSAPAAEPAQSANSNSNAGQAASVNQPTAGQQPKRILGVMPHYRAVSSGAIPTPPPKETFKIATLNSFDYSAFVFVGSLL